MSALTTKQSPSQGTGNTESAPIETHDDSHQARTAGPPAVTSSDNHQSHPMPMTKKSEETMTGDSTKLTVDASAPTGDKVAANLREGEYGVVCLNMGEKPWRVFEVLDSGGGRYQTDAEAVFQGIGYPPNYDRYSHDKVTLIHIKYCDVATMEKLKALDEVSFAFFERDRPEGMKLIRSRLILSDDGVIDDL